MAFRPSSFFGFALLFAVACSASNEQPSSTTVGVNDVVKACAITSAWANASTQKCTDCKGLVTTPKCACSNDAAGGSCNEKQRAVTDEPTCAGVAPCISACAVTDCGCVDRCYADKAKCRELASARDGCVTEVCDSHCR